MKRKRTMRGISMLLLAGVMFWAAFGANAQGEQEKAENPAAQQPTAPELTTGISVSAHNMDKASWVLTDRNRATKIQLMSRTSVILESEQEMASVYIIWDHTPDSWKLLCGDSEIEFDRENSFLHQYVALPEQTTRIELKAEDDRGILCDVYIFGKGEAPDWVQRWQMPYERADLLALPTHADDELLFFGGTLPYYAIEKGYRVQVAYLTNHNGEPYRPHELLNGLWSCGVRAYPIISDFPDYYSESIEHAMELYDVEQVLSYQTELIRRFRPYVVVGHDTAGEYGHGVHQLNAYGLMQIVNKTNDPEWFPESAEKYGVWEIPKLYLHLYPQNKIVMDWSVPIEEAGGKTAYQIACEAYQCHVSQQRSFQMGQKDRYRCSDFGLAHTTVGKDIQKHDFFENIVFEEETIQLPQPPESKSEAQSISDPAHEMPLQELEAPAENGKEPQTKASVPLWLFVALLAASGMLLLMIWYAVRRKARKKE